MKGQEGQEEATRFYKTALTFLNDNNFRYMVGGAFAFYHYTGIYRDTKDLDIFCLESDYRKILDALSEKGYRTEVTEEHWLAKAFKDDHFIDIIFNNGNGVCPVDESWFSHSVEGELHGVSAAIVGAEELIWSKVYVQNKERYDGSDVNHIILKKGKNLDWERLMSRMEGHWQLLFSQILNFQFVYPGENKIVPQPIFEKLLQHVEEQYQVSDSSKRKCRGPLLDHSNYKHDIREWEFNPPAFRR